MRHFQLSMANNNSDLDDFDFLAPDVIGASSSKMVFEAYLVTKQAIGRVPKEFRRDSELAVHTLLKENLRTDSSGKKLFRKKADASESLSRYWLARVSEAANFMEAWRSPPSFHSIDKQFLDNFARLSIEPENIKLVEEHLANYGIIVVHERSIPGMKVDGASFLLTSGRPVVALSLRYPRLDIYWFVLMHELAHISAHYSKLTEPILDDVDKESEDDLEIEANAIAGNSLIPRNVWRSANVRYNSSEAEILELANRAQTHPAIVAGRLQRESGKHYLFADIVNSVNTRQLIFGHE
jgi:HTH-type transcriptional regulator / antitoxin HigA